MLLSEYSKDPRNDDSGAYIDSPQFFVAGVEAIARLYPEEFRKRYMALSNDERRQIKLLINEVVVPLYGELWGRPLEAPKLIKAIEKD